MERLEEVSQLRAQGASHEPVLGRDHVHVHFAVAKGGCGLETNEAGADDHRTATLPRSRDDLVAVG
jgi:hypothetical protein